MSIFIFLAIFISVLIVWICLYIRNHLLNVTKCKNDTTFLGKTAIVTGANSGIGLETARELYRRGGRVILACRNKNRAEKATKHIMSTTTTISESSNNTNICTSSGTSSHPRAGELVIYQLDLASLTSVRKFCEEIKKNEPQINLLVNNAGIYNHPPECTQEDNLEIHMGVNHFGHFLLTNLLMDNLKASAPSRVVVLGSYLYSHGQIDFETLKKGQVNPNSARAYMNSKLANALFVRHFNNINMKHDDRSGSGVSIFYADPGIVLTNIDRYTVPSFIQGFVHLILSAVFKFPQEACQTILHCALSDEVESGFCYSECKRQHWEENVLDDGLAKKFWEKSEDLTGLSN